MPPDRGRYSFSFSPTDQLEEHVPPDVGLGPQATRFIYDADQRLIQVERPDGRRVVVEYDGLGRRTSIGFSRGERTYVYNSADGQVQSVSAPGAGTLAYHYDGFLQTQVVWSGPVSGVIRSTFDSSFRVASTTVNGSHLAEREYDRDGLLTRAGSLTLHRDPVRGLVTGSVLGVVTTSTEHDQFGEVSHFTATRTGVPFYSVTYERDAVGRIRQKIEQFGSEAPVEFEYGYDLAGRLSEVKRDGVVLANYGYDNNGNRLSLSMPPNTTVGTYDGQDRLVTYGATAYASNAAGELAVKSRDGQTMSFEYDELGGLHAVGLPDGIQIEYVIDGQGRRIGKKVNGLLVRGFLYEDGLRVAAELDGGGEVVSRFVYGLRPNVPEYLSRAGVMYRIITDHLGSPRLVVNAADGSIAQRLDYDEFGRVTLDTSPGFQPFGFAGGLYDPQTGLVRFGGRDYDAETGRWTTKDPIGFAGGSANLYVYVSNDPVNRVDPFGLFNVTKFAVGLVNIVRGVHSAAVGAVAAGAFVASAEVPPVSAGAAAVALYKIGLGAPALLKRGSQQMSEAWKEDCGELSFGHLDNLLGLAPFGQHLDDTNETIDDLPGRVSQDLAHAIKTFPEDPAGALLMVYELALDGAF